MIPPRRQKAPEDSVDSWLMSYADMITLLMCFFIIFVSVSEPKKDKISQIAEGMTGRFGSVEYTTPFTEVMRSLQQIIESRQIYKDVAMESAGDNLTLELATIAFFKPNSAEFSDAALPVVDDLVKVLAKVDFKQYRLNIEAHTNDIPPNSGLFPTNWDLSAAQAARVARLLSEKGFAPGILKATGFSDSRPKVPNIYPNGQPIPENRAKNQRIVIALEKME